jgi:hypothetical protein
MIKMKKHPYLTDEQCQFIEAQEEFRNAVRAHLNPTPPTTFFQKSIAFLNTQLGLWLLTSVLAGGIAWGVSEFFKRAEDSRQRMTKLVAIETEMSARFIRAVAELKRAVGNLVADTEAKPIPEAPKSAQQVYKLVFDIFEAGSGRGDELAGRSYVSLFIEREALKEPGTVLEAKRDKIEVVVKSHVLLQFCGEHGTAEFTTSEGRRYPKDSPQLALEMMPKILRDFDPGTLPYDKPFEDILGITAANKGSANESDE